MLTAYTPPPVEGLYGALDQLLNADDAQAALLLFRDGRCEAIATYRSAGEHVASYDRTRHPASEMLTPAAAFDAETVHVSAGLRTGGPASVWYPSKPPCCPPDGGGR